MPPRTAPVVQVCYHVCVFSDQPCRMNVLLGALKTFGIVLLQKFIAMKKTARYPTLQQHDECSDEV